MHFFWRSNVTELSAYRGWVERIDGKNRRQGTSAPTLALTWAGPLDVLGVLATCSELGDIVIHDVIVEARSRFDEYRGNVRNHDLVLRGTSNGEPLVVCVEAKAGEPLGATVAEQAEAAAKAKQVNPRSNASARVSELVTRLCPHPIEDPRVGALRYQLLTAWAGMLTEAAGASRAVFVVHEFRTDQRPDDKSAHNGAELVRFGDVVLGCGLPEGVPWCVRVPDAAGVDAALYVAHVVTDVRREALEIPPGS
jgi:Domain of unknown function (DUF6946)